MTYIISENNVVSKKTCIHISRMIGTEFLNDLNKAFCLTRKKIFISFTLGELYAFAHVYA